MMLRCLTASCVIVAGFSAAAVAQQVTITTPNHNVQNSFNERFGMNFGFNLNTNVTPAQMAQIRSGARVSSSAVVGLDPTGAVTGNGNIQFRQGSFGKALPPVGGFDQGSTAQAGFAVGGRAGTMFFNLDAGQGSQRTSSVEAPSVTMMNGSGGQFSDQSQTPFVTSVTPVVGGWVPGGAPQYNVGPTIPMQMQAPTGSSPLLERIQRLQAGEKLSHRGEPAAAAEPVRAIGFRDQPGAARQSTAEQGAVSLAEIQQQRALVEQTGDSAGMKFIERARQAEDAGKPGVAKIYYRMAAKEATGALKQQAEDKLKELAK